MACTALARERQKKILQGMPSPIEISQTYAAGFKIFRKRNLKKSRTPFFSSALPLGFRVSRRFNVHTTSFQRHAGWEVILLKGICK